MAPLLRSEEDHRGIAGFSKSIDARILLTRIIIVFLAAALFPVSTIVATTTSISSSNNNNDNGGNNIIECGVYLAPSSIPGAGLGMYVGNRFIDEGGIVTDEDILIPIVEREWHMEEHLKKGSFLWTEYYWNSAHFNGVAADEIGEEHQDDMIMISPGVGSAANSYLSMVNIDENEVRINRAGVPPESPGQGAFTIFHGRSFYATVEMEPGQEIFVDYGEGYFTSRVWAYGYIPRVRDYHHADRILEMALYLTLDKDDLADDTKIRNSAASGECGAANAFNSNNACNDSPATKDATSVQEEIWNDLHALMKDISDNVFTTSRVLKAIPSNASWIENLLEDGGTAYQDYNRSIKDLEWLEEHGQCADNIATGTSTIPNAGRGAFASRFIPSGGLVSPAPLVHMDDINSMVMFMDHVYNEDDDLVPNRSGPFTWQLLLNYCFAHKRSTLLLCPYGLLSSLINHSKGKGANTKIQWSDKHRMRHPEWLDKPIETWGSEYHTGLQLDFVATRDIHKGEEILIDYGETWQTAWDQHVEGFRFEEYRSEHYLPSYELNIGFGELRTEHDRDYRLDGVQLFCRGWYLSKHGIDMRDYDEASSLMCTIVKKLGDDDDDSYLVRIVDWDDNDEDRTWDYSDDWETAWGIPRDAFFFEDLPYSRDIHQEWAFRHPMMIPNEIFPEVWKHVGVSDGDGGHSFLRFEEKPPVEEAKEKEEEVRLPDGSLR